MPNFLINYDLFSLGIYFFVMLMESDLLALKWFRVTFPKAELFFIPIVNSKSIIFKFQVVLKILYQETWDYFPFDQVR